MRVLFSIRGMLLSIGFVGWGLAIYVYRWAILFGVCVRGLELLGLPVNTGEDPLEALGSEPIVALALLIFGPPVVLIGLARATKPGWRAREKNATQWHPRTLMVGVALVACLAAGLHLRAESFRRLAAYHRQASNYLDRKVGPLPSNLNTTVDMFPVVAARGAEASRAFEAALYHDLLEHKYLHAARHPWYPVSADPPAPPGAYPKFAFDPTRRRDE